MLITFLLIQLDNLTNSEKEKNVLRLKVLPSFRFAATG